MANAPFQLQGTVKFGTSSADTDVSNDVYSCTFTKTYDGIERKASFATGRKTTVAGSWSEKLNISFYNSGTNATSGTLDALIANAVWAATPTTTLYFEFRAYPGAAGTDNPKITGTVSILEAMKGGEVGTERTADLEMPVLTSTISNS